MRVNFTWAGIPLGVEKSLYNLQPLMMQHLNTNISYKGSFSQRSFCSSNELTKKHAIYICIQMKPTIKYLMSWS